jgi:putative transcriptional regulator
MLLPAPSGNRDMEHWVEMESLAGQLLIAPPDLGDPNFDGTVVFVIDHDAEGALGVVLNRPTETPVEMVLPELAAAVTTPDVFFHGGPVSTNAVVGVGRIGERLALVELDRVISGDIKPDGLRLFAGYSGWAPGQLDGELASGGWIVVDGFDGDVLGAHPDELWRDVLRRQGGAVGRLALYPDSPMFN